MTNEKKFDEFVNSQIKRINEFSKWEEYFNEVLTKKTTRKNKQFSVVDKEWIEKWKQAVGFDKIKDKCRVYSEKPKDSLKKDIALFFKNEDSERKLEELGQLQSSKIKKEINNKSKNINVIGFEETSNFMAIESLFFTYFNEKEKIYANGDFLNGKCFINNTFFQKNEKKKIVIFENQNNILKEAILTLESNEDLKKVKENLKNKTLEEMLVDNELKEKIIKKEINKNEKERKEKEDKERKEKEEKERKEKEEKEKKEKEEKERNEKENKERKEKEDKEKKEKDE